MMDRIKAAWNGLGVVRRFSDEERTNVLLDVGRVQIALNVNLQVMAHTYYWSDGLAELEINGLFRRQQPNRIYIRSGMESMLPELIPTICHALCHSKQLREMGKLKFAWYSLPLMYHLMLDREAIALEREAERVLGFVHSENT